MADVMEFPKTIEAFIGNYSFKDSGEVYTNGAELIPVFRVEQALEYYLPEIRAKAIDEFAEKCHEAIFKHGYSLDGLDITVIAEQLKEGGK